VLDGWTGPAGVERARARHAASVAELPRSARRLSEGDPVIPTVVEPAGTA
jgi:nicotinate phosphoribosyltransferase